MRDRIRTHDLLVRSQTLYPTELHAHKHLFWRCFLNAGDRNRTGTVLPQQDFKSCASASSATPAFINEIIINIMGRGGFEPPKQVAADLQSVPFGHSGICPFTIYIYITLLKKVQQHLLHIPNYFHYIHQIFFFFILIFDTKLY